MVSHSRPTDLDSASAYQTYQAYGQEEGDTGGVTTGFEGLRCTHGQIRILGNDTERSIVSLVS